MYFRIVRPEAADFAANLNLLRPAFVGSDNPKVEFNQVQEWIQTNKASFYLLSGKGVKLWFVSRVIDNRYHIVAMTGRGLVDAANFIIERVTTCGYASITYHTYRQGMRRILSRFGFEQKEKVRDFDGITETVHQLELLGGMNG
ncbi:hypothetical protein [Photobacterium lipolyticum]|uniref:Uncharacterized protein n=1 Tax=Photobacterium lipolyticum TaxID=266810 RepID=A0A2T3N1U5_9GAMM|nr:hypothetical protein [Photobacterium lipolyticum]PSW06266.1 hypothetical protein C9I89_07090 [Photobacterium lipolyticum]